MNATITKENPYKTSIPMFTVKPVEKWLSLARRKPLPKQLFGEFWHEGELALVYGGGGAGKSILAMQLAESIASGRSIGPLAMNAEPGNVLYLDFGMSDKQFEMRYAGEATDGRKYLKDHYKFPKNRVFRAEVDPMGEMCDGCRSVEECIDHLIREEIAKRDHKAIIVDDITFLRKANGHVATMLGLMRRLRRIKSEFGISVFVVASSRSRREGKPMTMADLGPGQILSRMADTVFAVAESSMDPEIRYIKQITRRNSRTTYGESNVPAFIIEKRDGNFLSFGFDGFSRENEHFARHECPMIQQRVAKVKALSDDGLTQRDIAEKIGMSLGSVNRYLHIAANDETCPHRIAEKAAAAVAGAVVTYPDDESEYVPDNAVYADDDNGDGNKDELYSDELMAPDPDELRELEPEREPTAAASQPAPWPISYLKTLRIEYDDNGKQLFVEKLNHLGKRMVWLKYSSAGKLQRWTKGIYGASSSPFEDEEREIR